MLVGFFGCCGAVRESQCLLGSVSTNARTEMLIMFSSSWKSTYIRTYFSQVPYIFQFFACLLIIFGAEVAAGVFGFLNKDKVHLLFYSLSSTTSAVTSIGNASLIFPLVNRLSKTFRTSMEQHTMKTITAH